MKDKTYVI